ncbi:hypothetical protein RN001_013229 [Aquatica leii]|uniref:Chitin-binding type-2 domain-containing protein n=1 Tax=Aquatica leii TaxID=1421715 RepID=A0AAN7SDR2_9COLE|nr:hypothetical protein RN001_013229 [Aquatica leii]
MIKILLVSISIAVLIQCFETQTTWFENTISFCHATGYACKNCHEVVLCVQNGSNFTAVPVETCDGISTCNNGTCSTKPNPKCNDSNLTNFVCQTGGMYPDVYDCKKFHYCIKDRTKGNYNHFTEMCGCGYSYNMKTMFCDIPLNNNHTCKGSFPKATCDLPGETGYLPENPALYYICRQHPRNADLIYPFLYACENGFTAIPVETCSGDSTCFNGTCTTKPNPNCNDKIKIDFICQTGGLYPDIYDCKKYHYCVKDRKTNLTRFTETCSCGYSFNMKTTFCDIPLQVNGTCKGIYPKAMCNTAGETGYMSENPSYYYICRHHPQNYAMIYPFLYLCENGKKYDPPSYLCH